jgi:RHS repeat-associated protein
LGNVITATDANGTVITNAYDKANRVVTKSYANEPNGQTTPAVEYFYDGKGLSSPQSPNFAKGKLTKVTSSVSETRYTSFDYLGRLLQMEQRTPVTGETIATAVPRVSSYQYNFSGALVQETYPSGRVVKNEFNSDGDLRRVFGQVNTNAVERTYLNNLSYTAAGGIERMKLGNGKWETAKFNERLQVTELGLGNGSNDTSLWKVNYEYGELENGTINAAKNTGNIAKQTLNFAGLPSPLVQIYKYDSLYRLTEAKEVSGTASNAPQNWIQNFGYDRYGNRLTFTQNIGGLTNSQNPTIDPNTNRFVTNQGFVYDKNGNVTSDIDPKTAQSRSFVFNGDNKQTEIKNAYGVIIGKYYYDGEGNRVKKETDTETTIFVYSSGKLVAEYSTQTPPQNPTTKYLSEDHLGTPRIITDAVGNVVSRRDFMPFGEELTINVGARSNALKYGTVADNVRQKFTGYQKDDETSLDFAEARMYENRFGRFTAVDPLLASGNSANPQTFNRYSYVGNNPISITDPLGLDWYSRKKDHTTTYQWFDDKPTEDGWNTVNFGAASNRFLRLDNACETDACNSTVYLNRYGNSSDHGEGLARENSLASFFGTFSGNDPKQLAARNENVRESTAGAIGGILGTGYDAGAGTYNLGAWTSNKLGANLPYAPYYPLQDRDKPVYYALNTAVIAQGGVSLFRSVKSGVNAYSAFRAGGTTFGERLFMSETFGITSARFGNTGVGVQSSWNKAGSFLKAGWSGAKNGGGMQFRVGVLPSASNPSVARFHIFVPKSFVPYSYTGPAMQLKQSLMRIEQAKSLFPLQF